MQVDPGDRGSSPDLPCYDSDEDAEEVATEGFVVPPSHLVNERAVWLEQQQAGQVIFTPSSGKLLNDMLDEVYAQLQPKGTDWDARQTVIQFITKFINHKIPGSSISAFGSFVMDLFTSSSDLDLSLNIADGRFDRSRNDKVHYLRKVAKALYGLQNGQRQSVRGIETVYRAAVPVVKFVECRTGIECDISVENNDGVLKSQVLRMFSTMDARFRQLCYLVKAWAKKHNVNSSKNGTLNSLSICLLVAFHLQTCSPPILPPFSVFMEGLHMPEIGSCLETVASRVRDFKDRGFGKDNTESVPELFCSFFLKVEDFADRTQNVARSVSRKEFELIYQVLQSTLSNLKDPVFDVLEAKDLKAYLFGSIKQRRRGWDHAEPTLHMGNWQGGNGWSHSVDRRAHQPNSKGHEPSDHPLYHEQTWVYKAQTPVHFNHSHSHPGRGPSHRPSAYRKVGLPNGIAKVDPTFDARGLGEDRGLQQLHHYDSSHAYRMQNPRLDSRPQAVVDDMRQVSQYPGHGNVDFGGGYRDIGPGYRRDYRYKREIFPSGTDPRHSGGYVLRDIDFPTIAAERRDPYSDNVHYAAVGPPPVECVTYGEVGSGPQRGLLSIAPEQHRSERYRHGRRGRKHRPAGLDSKVQQYNANGHQGPIGGNVNWQAQSSSNCQFLIS